MTPDPIEFDAGDTNLYRYVGNDPANKSDPLGLQELPGPKKVDAGGRGCPISQSANPIRYLLDPDDKATLLKHVPFEIKDHSICVLDKSNNLPTCITGDMGWSGIIPKGAYVGPDGCGPCVGIALLPPKSGGHIYVMHFSSGANVSKGFEEVGFISWTTRIYPTPKGSAVSITKNVPAGYEAVICGALKPRVEEYDFAGSNATRLHTLEDVVLCCRRNGVAIRSFIPSSGFAVDANGQVYWTTDPSEREGDRFAK